MHAFLHLLAIGREHWLSKLLSSGLGFLHNHPTPLVLAHSSIFCSFSLLFVSIFSLYFGIIYQASENYPCDLDWNWIKQDNYSEKTLYLFLIEILYFSTCSFLIINQHCQLCYIHLQPLLLNLLVFFLFNLKLLIIVNYTCYFYFLTFCTVTFILITGNHIFSGLLSIHLSVV